MRSIGLAEMALESMIHRARTRRVAGGMLAEKDAVKRAIAEARLAITQSRQLCYLAAAVADAKGFKEARKYVAMIKISAPRTALMVIDEAIQMHGAAGLSQDSALPEMYMGMRTLRVADGPDSAMLGSIADMEMSRQLTPFGSRVSGENANVKEFRHLWDRGQPAEERKKAGSKGRL